MRRGVQGNVNIFLISGIVTLSFLTIVAVGANYFAPVSPVSRTQAFLSPSSLFFLGTDDVGHDIFSQLLFASRVSLITGISAAIISVTIGTVIGLFAGYFRGIVSEFLAGIIDVFLLVPVLPLMVTLGAYAGSNLFNIVLIIAMFSWCSTARVVQSRTIQLREWPFVEALQALGISHFDIIFKHIFFNVTELVAAKLILAVAQAMLSEATLSFMGLGDPTHLSWGGMMYYAFHRGGFVNNLWYWYLPPGLCIALAAMGFAFLGFALEKSVRYRKVSE